MSRQDECSDGAGFPGCSQHSSPWRSSQPGGFIYFAFVSRHRSGPSCRHITASQGAQRRWLVCWLFPDNLAAYKSIKTRLLGTGASSSSSHTAVGRRDCATGTIKLVISFQNWWAVSGEGARDQGPGWHLTACLILFLSWLPHEREVEKLLLSLTGR